ncbi:hypothetical protein BV22DRAFT_250177 [Leucogyrophana mollusca]|uniref:Uncharacterized protein n=1 Tax=Leucogyrophana mollusca TaxID=85980 RepID=A0ACB8BQL9_9AGAM|nr:hypothetical protein BV22DRAFT_250177 [Leucogyrophana mollusca]
MASHPHLRRWAYYPIPPSKCTAAMQCLCVLTCDLLCTAGTPGNFFTKLRWEGEELLCLLVKFGDINFTPFPPVLQLVPFPLTTGLSCRPCGTWRGPCLSVQNSTPSKVRYMSFLKDHTNEAERQRRINEAQVARYLLYMSLQSLLR